MRKARTEEGPPLLCIVDPSLKDFVGHHFEYDAAVAAGGRDMGYEVVCLAHIGVQKAVSDVLSVRPTFTYDIWGAQQLYPDQPKETAYKEANRVFLEDLDRATHDLAIDERTIIFGHMITAAQLEGWAAFAARTRARRPTLVLLCRYELAHYRGETANGAFRALERLQRQGVRIRLATDSARLSRHLSRLTSLPVEVFPIPHTLGHQQVDAKPAWSGQSPLVVSMLGNARDEKGWVELLAAIEVLASQGRAQAFRFIIQANNPDAACARALSRLQEDLPDYIELKTQSLEPLAYAALLANSDIVVLPYWRSIYEARTSGVLVEALSAGRPVICTEATWLGDQIAAGQGLWVKDRNPADLARQLWAMRTDYPRYAMAAQQAREAWVGYHNPASLAAALTRGGPPPTAAAGVRVALFYPWGDAQTKGSGASLRLNLLARYLSSRAESVTVLEDSRHAPKTIGGVHFESHALLEQGDASRLGQRLKRWLTKLLGVANGEELYLLLHIYPSHNRIFRRHVEEVVRSSDIVFLEYAFWAPLLGPICRDLGKPLIITAHDVVADQVRSSRVARWITAQLELHGLRQARSVAVVSTADQAAFARHGISSTVIPHFVDAQGLRAMPKVDRAILNRLIDLPETDRSALFVFIGSRFRPNEVAAEHLRAIAAETRAKYPGLAFRIVVAGSCCEATRADGFIALGHVDEAVLPLLYQHATMVAIPLTLGTGASLKTVEALGAGAPVLGTSVAFRGLNIAPGVDCIVEDDLNAWPDRLAELTYDRAMSDGLRAGAAERGVSYDYASACDAYLPLVPEIAGAAGETHQAANSRTKAVMALAQAGRKAGLVEVVAPYLDDLRRDNPADAALAQIQAELLSNGSDADASRAVRLFREAFEAGGDVEPCLFGLFKTSERLGDDQEADRAARLAARLFSLKSAHQEGDAAVREALWTRFHAGERAWTYVIARDIALVGPDVHQDYHYLFSLLEVGEGADHELGLAHAEMALASGFDRYWSLSLIAHHQAALGRAGDATATLSQATDAAKNEEQRRMVLDARLVNIWELFHKRNLDEARQQASDLIVDAPDMASAYYVRAECKRLLESPVEESITDYEKALQLGHDPVWCRLHSGRLLVDAKRFEEAAERLIGAFPGLEDPHQIQCWRDGMAEVAHLGVNHLDLGLLRGIMSKAARLDPANGDLETRLRAFGPDPMIVPPTSRRDHLERIVGSTFQKQDYRLALAQAGEAHTLFSQEPIFIYYTAHCLHILVEKLDDAEIYYGQAINLSMEPFWPLMNRGQLRRKLGRFKEAHEDLDAALQAARNPSERAQAASSLRDLEAECREPA